MHLLHRQEKDEKPMKDLVMGVPSKAKKKHQHKQILWWPYLTVVMCEQYKSISRSKFAKWWKIVFLKHWTWRSTPMIDGLFRMENLATIMVSIPSRSPDSNCIEKFFHLVENAPVEDTKNKNITKKTFYESPTRA